MIRYVLWQCKHMHTLSFEHNERGEVYCPTCKEIYQKRKSLSTKPKTPKPQRSVFASISLGLLIFGFILVCAGIIISNPYVIALGGFDAVASVTLAVLSLRESQQ